MHLYDEGVNNLMKFKHQGIKEKVLKPVNDVFDSIYKIIDE